MGKAMMDGDYNTAEDHYKKYMEMFGDDLYIEFHPTDLTHNFNRKTGGFDKIKPTLFASDGNQQKAYNKFLAEMVDKHGGKPIPATDAHFIKPEDKIIQDCLLKNGNDDGWYFYESYHQHTADEIFDMLKKHLGDWLTEDKFNKWIDNTYEVMSPAKDIKYLLTIIYLR
jgi:DNA polymerase III alpha subunit